MKKSTTVLILIGILGLGLMVFGKYIGAKTPFYSDDDGFHLSGEYTQKGSLEENIDPFSALEIEVTSGNVNVESGDIFSITFEGDPKNWKIENSDGELSVSQVRKFKLSSFGINFSNGQIGISDENKITIQIPENTTLSKLDLSMFSGMAEIENIKSNKIDLEIFSGFVRGNGISSTNFDAELKSGTLNISGDLTGEINLKMDSGLAKIDLSRPASAYNIDTSVSSGNVSLNQISISKEIINVDAKNSIDIDVSAGNVEINTKN